MSASELLLACIAALYLVECVVVVRPDEVLFEKIAGRWRERRDGVPLHGLRLRLVLTNPFSFEASHLIASRDAPVRLPDPSLGTRLRAASEMLAPLRADGAMLALFVFLFAPVTVLLTTVAHAWLPLVALGAVLIACVIADFRRAHRALRDRQGSAWSVIATLLVSPAAAMRAHHLFARELAGEFHPFVIAHALCDPDETRRVVANERRTRSDDSEIAWFLEQFDGGPTDLGVPRDRDASARSYCPRCLGQYSLESGSCADCDDVALARFPAGAIA